ncbi:MULTISPECIES: hypothetical protein [Aneurinibacillus]|uniref:Uncharacterized protein n=1 Tax=Aneurinibacillus thermoaerophilus TaxID=143495 RepID=A0A1G7XZ94_ANETH|nr:MULTISPECIES: hypothetical protein [Aneurinibacillus]MED0675950.1 hypothetical protein [Aneurinibacillus thermoaerophilus]MED0677775.1 hypothetical protein [Aneurinibacillus thermoaerophilus]MED0737524.1 hypothetical protein [Aneurinibacillus thermoaerophilus]MED0758095.1 hypothetical protein [Aneurinibacillus thermoaerophilus]MED0761249.1 hypothetical protein [Aneurinibacillus thermoaerophilus]
MTDENKRQAMERVHPRSHPSRLDQFGRDGQIPITGQEPPRFISMTEAEREEE